MVSTHLKNISQKSKWESSPNIGENKKNKTNIGEKIKNIKPPASHNYMDALGYILWISQGNYKRSTRSPCHWSRLPSNFSALRNGQLRPVDKPDLLNHRARRNMVSDPETISGWWFQPTWKIESNWIISPRIRGENKKYLKPPPRYNIYHLTLLHDYMV